MAQPVIKTLAVNGVPATFVEAVGALIEGLELGRDINAANMQIGHKERAAIGRALSMSITSLEDARTRYTEARARQLGVYAPADLDRPRGGTAESERQTFLTEAARPNLTPYVETIDRILAAAQEGRLTPKAALSEIRMRAIDRTGADGPFGRYDAVPADS
jgi:hypothetical protein